ncbi:helix-turn-helix domain-containing protein [Sphaerisporangium sp. TRM90804]|uniref:helix-turn-helix domain-containing protein n=1 Tax=Sphaerisporangium sp. TRM90804 TaxID=3031113 RepID=UPI002448B97D|nr:helix-turn-helix domain-containing protein [Sphaerisporangium sp. TRM90804]MDH2430463.1 helix-turn-helix domain-containing protein [Sphaerisporangium sp. TRM90804]
MRTFVHGAAVWEVSRPRWPSRVPGVAMAGFRVGALDALRMVPHPAVTLLVDFGPGSPVLDDATGRQQRGSVVAGPGAGSGGAVWARGENVECLQVRLSPMIARAVLGVSPADLDGAVVALDDLWGREASRIRERLGEASSWHDRFALTDALLARRHEAGPPVDPEVARAWSRIIASRGLARVDGLAAEVGWSRKRLWSRFRSQLGLRPKHATKLVRFDHAAHRLVAGEATARVAADAGYADQSHLHRDVMAFTGVTPATVAAEPFLAVDDIAWPAPEHEPPANPHFPTGLG